jgi:histidyl-tRNA synthetase
LKLAAELRAKGIRVEMYPEADKLGKQMKYAATRKIRFAAILGGDEIGRGEVTIKNLETGVQQSMPRAALADLVIKHQSSVMAQSADSTVTLRSDQEMERRKENGERR